MEAGEGREQDATRVHDSRPLVTVDAIQLRNRLTSSAVLRTLSVAISDGGGRIRRHGHTRARRRWRFGSAILCLWQFRSLWTLTLARTGRIDITLSRATDKRGYMGLVSPGFHTEDHPKTRVNAQAFCLVLRASLPRSFSQ